MRCDTLVALPVLVVVGLSPAWAAESLHHTDLQPSQTSQLRNTDASSGGHGRVICPETPVSLSDVNLAAELQRRHSLSRAVRGEKRVASAAERLAVGGSRFANDANEAARMIQRDFGPDSLFTRGAQGVLAVASAAERGTQIPLDRINAMADALVEAGRQAFDAPSFPAFRFRSHVGHEQAGVRLSASW